MATKSKAASSKSSKAPKDEMFEKGKSDKKADSFAKGHKSGGAMSKGKSKAGAMNMKSKGGKK